VAPDKLNELAKTVLFANNTVFSSDNPDEDLLLLAANWNDELAADGELFDERLGDFRAAGCHEYRIVRRVVAPANRPVEPLHGRVVAAELPYVSLRRSSEIADSLYRKHAAGYG
jgi:hypothetical protein